MPVYTLPELPYDYDALEPHFSAEILELHHGKHHAAYVAGANTTLEKLGEAREAGDFGAINQLAEEPRLPPLGPRAALAVLEEHAPDGGGEPEGELAAAIDERFGVFDALRSQLTEAALNVQGSGWGALVVGALGQRLIVEQVYDHQGNVGQGGAAAARARHVGARLLPAVQEREGRLGRGLLEDRQLARRPRRFADVQDLRSSDSASRQLRAPLG